MEAWQLGSPYYVVVITVQPRRSILPWTVFISLLVTVASLLGLLETGIYAQETANWALQAKGQDIANLLAVATLLLSCLRYRAGSIRAGLIWLGTLVYLIYAYIVYAMAVHLNALFLMYVAILGITAYVVLFNFRSLFAAEATFPVGPRRSFAAWTLMGTGALFAILWLAELVPALLTGQVPASLREAGLGVNPIHVLDLAVVLPGFILTGVAVLKGRGFGLFWAAPWLVFSALMGSGIVAAMLLMASAGFPNTAAPTLMVTIVVTLSTLALRRYIRETGSPQAKVTTPAAQLARGETRNHSGERVDGGWSSAER